MLKSVFLEREALEDMCRIFCLGGGGLLRPGLGTVSLVLCTLFSEVLDLIV